MRIDARILTPLAAALVMLAVVLPAPVLAEEPAGVAAPAETKPAGEATPPGETQPAGEATPPAPETTAPKPDEAPPPPATPEPVPPTQAPPAAAAPAETKPADQAAPPPAPETAAPKPEAAPPPAGPEPVPPAKAPVVPAAPAQVGKPNEIRFQFDGIPYDDVVRRFSQMVGKPLLGNYHIEGTLTFFDSKPYAFEEAFDTFNLLLAMQGYTLIETNRYLRVLPVKEATKGPLRIIKGWDDAEKVRPGELVTMMLPLKFISAEDAVRVLMPVVSTFGSVAPLGRGRGIIITDRLENMQRIRVVLDELDTGELSVDRQIKTYKLKRASSRDIATIVNNLFGEGGEPSNAKFIRNEHGQWVRNPNFGKPTDKEDLPVKATADERTNTLFLVGPGEKIALAEQVVLELDAVDPGQTGDMRIFELKNAKAEELANTIRELLPGGASPDRRGRPGPAPSGEVEARVVADANTNRLIITAPLDQMARIEELIKTLDQGGEDAGGMRIFRLKVADAQQLAGVVGNAIGQSTDQDRRGRRPSPMASRVIADQRTNSLIVSGTAADIQTAEKLIDELDRPLEGESREIHVVQLQAGDARELAQAMARMLSQQDPRRPGAPSASNVRVEAESGTNSLLISASPGDWPVIEKLLEQLKASAAPTATASTRIIPLEHAKAVEVAQSLTQIYAVRTQMRMRGRRPGAGFVPVVITASQRNNSLLVSAAGDDQQDIAELVKAMDVPADEKVDPVHVVEVKSGDAEKIAEVLQAMQAPSEHGGPPRAFIRGDRESSTIVIRARDAEFKALEQMVAQLDKTITTSGGLKTFQLKVADARQLAEVLQNALSQREPGRRGQGASTQTVVSADSRTNSLIVAGSAGDIQTAEKLIAELDKPLGAESREIHVVPIAVGNVRELAESLTRMLNEEGRGRKDTSATVRVEAETGTNSLLISAGPGDWPIVEKLLEQLKASAAPFATATTRLVPLKHAKASELAETLRLVYGGARGRPMPGHTRPDPAQAAVPVVIAASDQSNSLLISAADDDQRAIGELIKAMDVPMAQDAELVRMIRLESADAERLAQTLKAMIPPAAPGKSATVFIEADSASNAVLIRGPEADRKVFEDMIASLDKATQSQAREVRMIALKHVSAATLAPMLTQLYSTSPTMMWRGRRGGPPRPMPDSTDRVVVAAAPGDRMLVVDAPREKIEEIVTLVASLDVADAPGQIEVRTYRLASAKAPELAPALARLFAQQPKRPGAPQTEPQPKFEADAGTNQVLVAATPTQFETIDKLIEKLEADTSLARETKTYRLKVAKATELVTVLQTMLVDSPAGPDRPGRPEPSANDVRVAAMAETNDVVVQGPPEKIALAEQLIKTFDTEGAGGESGILIVKLKNAQAASLAEAVNQALASKTPTVRLGRGRGGPVPQDEDRVTVTPELNSNSVLVRGPSVDIPEVVQMIKALDDGSTSSGAEVRVYPLVHSDPLTLADSLRKLFGEMTRQQAAGGRGQPVVPFSIAADDRTNSLVISATPSHFTLVEGILKALDQAPSAPEADVQYIWLENADATEVASQLNDMYKTRKGVDKPVITADEFGNAVTIIAKDIDLKVIEPIIAKLDDAAKDNSFRVRVIPLTQVKAEKMAQVLRTVYKQMSGNDIRITEEVPPDVPLPPTLPAPGSELGPRGEAGPEGATQPATDEPPVTIAVDKNSNSLIISGKRQELDYIEDLVDQLMLSTTDVDAEFRIFKVEKADPQSVANTLDALFNPRPKRQPQVKGQKPVEPPPAPPPTINVVADVRTRTVIVRAKPVDFEDVERLIKQLDQVPQVISEVRIFALKNTDATEVSQNLKDLFQRALQNAPQRPPQQPQQKGQPPQPQQQRAEMIRQLLELRTKQGITQVDIASMVNVSANKQTNSVIVTAPADAMEIVSGIIEELDQSGMAATTSVRMYPVKTEDVSGMVKALNDLFAEKGKAARPGMRSVVDKSVVITGDEAGQLVIVSAPPDMQESIAQVVTEMDKAQDTGEMTTKVYRLKKADASTVAQALSQTVGRSASAQGPRAGGGTAGQTRISADRSSNSIVVRASAEAHVKIAMLIEEMDQTPEAVVKTYPVKHAEVQTVVTALRDVFASSGRGGAEAAGADRVSVSGDETGRLVVVSASTEKHVLIDKVIAEIDQAQETDRVTVKVYRLQHAAAIDVEGALQATFQKTSSPTGVGRRMLGPQAQATGQVRVSADESSNSLIVRANAEDHERIAALIKELDVAPADKYAVRLIPLKNADPDRIEEVLDQTFMTSTVRRRQWGSGRVAPTLVIEADADARMLVVSADDETFEKVKALAEKLDVATTGTRGEPVLIPMAFAKASSVADAVSQAFQPPRGQRPRPDEAVTVVAEPLSNSLIVTASAENLKKVRDLVGRLDTEKTAGMRTELVLLKNARAVEVAPVLQQMVRTGQGGGARSGRFGPAPATEETVTVGADAGSNGLVISGPTGEIEKVMQMARDLDKATADVGMPVVKTYPIKNAEISTVVTALEEIFETAAGPAGRGARGSSDPSRVTVTGDEAGRLVIVSAPQEKHTLVAKVIDEIDKAQTADLVTIKVYHLENAEADIVAEALQETIQKSAPAARRRWWEPQPAAAGQVRVRPDSSSNSLIVRANAEDHEQIAQLIAELDVAPTDKYAVRLIPLTNADAEEVASVLNRVFTSSQQRRGPFGSRGSSRASVVIEADRNARMLAVRADDEAFEKIRELATQLDTASPAGQAAPTLIPLKFAQAASVATAIDEAFQPARGRGQTVNPDDLVRVVAEPFSNSLVVSANAQNLAKVKTLVEKLDTEASGGIRTEMLILTKAKAEDLEPVLSKMVQSSSGPVGPMGRRAGGAGQPEVKVSAERGSNALVFSGPSGEVEKAVQMAKDLDQATSSAATSVRVIPLKNGDAPAVASMVEDLYRQQYMLARRDQKSIDPLAVSSDVRANAIVLATSDEMYEQVSEWVAKIEEMQPQRGSLRIITLKHANPTEVEQAIRQIFGEQTGRTTMPIRSGRSLRGAQGPVGATGPTAAPGATGRTTPGGKVETTVLPQQRSILINASDEDFETIQKLAEALDAAAADAKLQFRVFALKNTNNARVAQALQTLYRAGVARGPAAASEDVVTVTALPDTNAVVVSAAVTKMEEVAHLIEELDKEEIAPQLEFRIYPLENAQPTKVMPVLQQMLAQVRQTRPGEPLNVQADERTRSVIVTARGPMFDQVEQIIKTLDKKPSFAATEVLIIPLKKSDATRLAVVLNEILRPSTAGQVTPEARALQEQVRLLKVRSADGQVLPELDLTMPIKISADPALAGTQGSNALVIQSTVDNLKALAALVDVFDRVPLAEATKVRVVHLKNADAESVAGVLEDIFTQGQRLAGEANTAQGGNAEPESVSGKALVNPFNVSADPRTNTLVMSGLEESLALADLIIKDLDRDAGKVVTDVRLFRLKHADVTRLVPMLQAVFDEAAPTPGTEGLQTQVTRLRTVLKQEIGHVTEVPKTRPAFTIQADPMTSIIIVAARTDVMPLIADVINTLDVPGAGSMNSVRILPLVNADATRLKSVVDGLYGGPNAALVRPEDVPTVEVDTRTNALVVSASEKTFAMISTLMKRLDAKQPIEMRDIRLVPLQNAEATTVGPALQEMMDARVQRFSTLGAADAEALRVIIIPDARSNSLMVGGSAEGFQLVKSLAAQLDGASPALSGQIQLFPLTHANAGTISTTLANLFDQRYQAARTPDIQRQRPIVLPDVRVNALLVAANADDTKVIVGLLKQLDVELTDPSVQLVVIPLEHNDAGIVGPMLQQIFAARLQSMTLPGQTPVPQDRVDVATEALSNSLIVSASKENLAMIKGLLAKVDVEPPDETGIVRMYPLQNSDAQRIATMLQALIQQGLYKPGVTLAADNPLLQAREQVSVAVDIRTNVLIVSASKENFAVIEEIIRKIDSSEDFSVLGDIRLFTLKNANAVRLAPTLQQLFTAKLAAEQAAGGTGRMLPVSIIADPRTNTLLVAGSRESFNAIEAMIRELDTDQVLAANEFRVFYLEQATATALQPTLQQLFAQRVARGAQDPVTIVPEARTNALIISASPEDMRMAESLIKRLDAEPDRPGTAVGVFAMAKADATQVANTLTSLYQAPGAAAGPTVGISVDERINAVVVSAGPADLKRIGDLVKELDTDTLPRVTEIRVFTLENADATEMAQILNDAINQKPTPLTAASPNRQALLQFVTRSKDGGEMITSALQEGVLITPDRRSNSLVISAPIDNMPFLESLVKAMDATSPRTAEIRVFTLVNSDARAMATVLNELFRMQATPAAGKQAIKYTLVPKAGEENGAAAVIGSAEDVALTVTVDVRTNSLLVGGTKHYVSLAGQVIEELDRSTAAERLTEIYRLRNAQAPDIETALTDFLSQERALLEQSLGPQAAGTAQFILEREVAIVAEETSNTLLLSASPRYFDVIATMIKELDQPPPQVLIQVLLAEVSIDDVNEFGIEWRVSDTWEDHNLVGGTAPAFAASAGLTLNPGFSVSVTGGDVNFLLRALESQGRLEVLSRPQILASDNQLATINIGQRVPFITNSRVTEQGTTINTIQYEEIGIILEVTPRINPDGFVRLEVRPEISSLDDSTVPISEGVNAIIVNNRAAETTVTVQDGHTIIVGGLITTGDRDRVNKVPILGDIPILGHLFRSTRKVKERTELLIIMTPTVLRNIEEADVETDGQIRRLNLLRNARKQPLKERAFDINGELEREVGLDQPGADETPPAPGPDEHLAVPAAPGEKDPAP